MPNYTEAGNLVRTCGNDWSDGFLLFTDRNRNQEKEVNEVSVKAYDRAPSELLISNASARILFKQGKLKNAAKAHFSLRYKEEATGVKLSLS